MENKLKAVLILPETKEIKEVFLDKLNVLNEWYEHIGNGCMMANPSLFYHKNNIVNAIISDDFLIRFGSNIVGGITFTMKENMYFLHNNVLLLGLLPDGSYCDCNLTTQEVELLVKFYDKDIAEKVRDKIIKNQPYSDLLK